MRAFGFADQSQVFHGDARRLPFRSVDAIATDIPYGRASSTLGDMSSNLFRELVENASLCLKNGRRLVVMHPKEVSPVETKGFEQVSRYDFFVHRNLTRNITVFQRRT